MEEPLLGVYHQVSVKHLGRYVGEFTFRLNDGNVQIHTLDRLHSLLLASRGADRMKPPPELDAIADKVLGYRPKDKAVKLRKKARKAKKGAKKHGRLGSSS